MSDRLHAVTELAPEALDRIARQHRLGPIHGAELCKAGLINSNYRVSTSTGTFLVRVYSPERTLEHVEFELSTLQHLSRSGFPCQRPMPSEDGALTGRLDERLYAVLTFLPGSTLRQEELHPAVSEQIGTRFAELQNLLQGFQPRGRKPDADYPLIRELVPEVFERVRQAPGGATDLELLEADWAELEPRFRPERDPRRQVVHGDLYYQNVLFDGGRLTGIIDFDDAYVGSPLLDLALVVMEFATPATNWLELRLAEPLLRHYARARPVAPADAESLTDAMRFLCFKFLGYTLPLTLEKGLPPSSNSYFQRLSHLRDAAVRQALTSNFQRFTALPGETR